MGRAKDALVAGLLLLARRRKRRLWPGQRERIVPPAPQNSGSEVLASLLLLAAAGCGVAFVVVYVLDRLPAHTQLLGLSLGLACLFVAAALVVTAKRLIVTEELEDDCLVDERGQPYRASDIEEDTLYTAFAEGSEKEEMGSSIVLVRLPKDLLRLPSGQAGYDAGEIALYAFIVLVATGVYLTFFYENSTAQVVYHGPYVPLQGQEMTQAYRSVLDISTTVKAGLLIRQTHHWAADIFIAAIVLHLIRI